MRVGNSSTGNLAARQVHTLRQPGVGFGLRPASTPWDCQPLEKRECGVRQRRRRGARHDTRHIGHPVVEHAIDEIDRDLSAWSVSWFQTARPWSTATSTMTDPGFMRPTSSRETNLGARAPGTRTAPITRSAAMHRFFNRRLSGGPRHNSTTIQIHPGTRSRSRSRLITVT